MALQKLLLKNLFNVGIYKYLGELIFFLSSVVISRLLLPSEFGIIAMATVFYSFLARFTDMGVSEAVIRETGGEIFFRSIQSLYLLIGLGAGIVMAGLAYPIAVFFDQEALFPVGLTYGGILLLYAFPKAMIAYLRKEEKLVLIAKIELVAVVFQVLCSIILAWSGFSYWSLVIPHVLAPFLYYFFYRYYIKIPFEFSASGVTDVWHKVKSLVYTFGPLNFMQYWEKNIDNLWVGRFYGETGLGLYNRAYMLMSMPVNVIRGHINTVLFPLVANRSSSMKEIKGDIVRFIKFLSAVITFPAIIFILVPVKLSVLLWGESWSGVGEYLGVLAIALFVLSFNQLSTNLYIILRKERVYFINSVISGVVSIVFISVGAVYSIEMMIYLYVGSTLLISFPITLYLAYYKSFCFSFLEIIDMVIYYYVSALVFLGLKLFALDDFMIYPAIFVVVVSLIRLISYFKSLADE